jgi:acyl-CoA synthetase (AMP-forming)/AMP-acid ligase II
MDENGRDVARGQTGELIIYGSHVCAGYWRNPEATAKALQNGWFHTGDMARQDEDGFYYMAGRYKDMIISGGENVYAAEVETIFLEHPAVREAALIGLPDEKWGEVGLMVVVARPDMPATAEDELIDFCRARLARYKVPKQRDLRRRAALFALWQGDEGGVAREVCRCRRAGRRQITDRAGGGRLWCQLAQGGPSSVVSIKRS